MNLLKLLIILLLFPSISFAQIDIETKENQIIEVRNPSFEADESQHSIMPKYWNYVHFIGQTPVDIHGVGSRFFQVEELPIHGMKYLGLVARPDSTYEGVLQQLNDTLKAGQSYRFSLYCKKAKNYISGVYADETIVKERRCKKYFDNGKPKTELGSKSYYLKSSQKIVVNMKSWK